MKVRPGFSYPDSKSEVNRVFDPGFQGNGFSVPVGEQNQKDSGKRDEQAHEENEDS